MSISRHLVVALALAGGAACSSPLDLTDPRVVAVELRGTWSQTFDVPGMSFVFQLTVQDTTIAGTGTFAGEAGPSGTLSLTGQVATVQIGGPLVEIDFTRSDGVVFHFNGTLRDTDLLTGSLWTTSDPVTAEFRRTSH
jgi:hypothetical protein